MQSLELAKTARQLEMDAEYEAPKHVIMVVKKELSRLQKHPELFPNKDIQKAFWYIVQKECNFTLNSVIPGQDVRDHELKAIQTAAIESEEDRLIPGRDRQRKPWEQFFHNRAPGTEANLSMFPEGGSLQIIPMAAARILVAHIDEHKAAVRDVEAVSSLHPEVSSIMLYKTHES